jgi:dipeptidyl aminopeptidase/acylaminoacyl peptidase
MRAGFRSRLRTHGPAPQGYDPTALRPDAREIPYPSGGLALKAWVSPPPADGKRRPGVLFLHGGFAFGEDDWDMAKPYRDAGYVVLAPMLRGENGLPGDFSMFYAEIDDALAAADALAALPYVQADHLYVAGHSIGGTHALLAAMYTGRFRAAASFAGSPNQYAWIAGARKEQAPFDTNDQREMLIRSPLAFAASFQCPVRAYHGTEEIFFAESTAKLAEIARGAGLDVRAVPVPGDHMTHVAEAMRQSITFFHEHE